MGLRDAGELSEDEGERELEAERARIAKRDKNKAASARYYASKPGVRERKRLQVAKSRAAKKLAKRQWDPPKKPRIRNGRNSQTVDLRTKRADLDLTPDLDSAPCWDIRCLTPDGLLEHLQVSLDLKVRSPAEQDAIYVLTELSNRRDLEAAYSNQGLQFNSGTPVTHQKDSTRGKATLQTRAEIFPPDLPPSDDLGTSEEEYDIPEYGYKPAVDRQVNITPDDTWMLYAPKYDSSDDDLV
ncbi:hypothetical protein B0H10DRAFT_2123667 [Mycena sp. CBHHK59/15]|nr:hypothetical protein B0H10DRAFT_2123667 [Mycena sp. CBHHK59/15]